MFVVDDPDRFVTFNATNVANIARAAVPADRADDVYVFVGTLDDLADDRPTVRGEPEYDALSRITLSDLPEGERAIFVAPQWNLAPSALVDDRLVRWTNADDPEGSPDVRSSVPDPRPLPRADDELAPSSPVAIALASLAVLALLWVVGAGWSRWAFDDRVAAAATGAGVRRGDPDRRRVGPRAGRRAARRSVGPRPRLSPRGARWVRAPCSCRGRRPRTRCRRSARHHSASTSIAGVTIQWPMNRFTSNASG